MRLIFAGHENWARLSLDGIIKQYHKVPLVICESKQFIGKAKEPLTEYCSEKNILNIHLGKEINDEATINMLHTFNPDVILMVSYHQIIKKPLLDNFKVVNIHCAPLPYYRGRSPIQWAIMNGETKHGVTAHYVDEGIDTGNILAQEFVDIEMQDRGIDVLNKCMPLFPKLALSALELVSQGCAGFQQNKSEGSYFRQRKPTDGYIEWHRSTKDVYNFIRALIPMYSAFCEYKNKIVNVVDIKAHFGFKRMYESGVIFGKNEDYYYISTGDGGIEAKFDTDFKLGDRLI